MGDAEVDAKDVLSKDVQVIWVVRHGDRLDNFDPTWRKAAQNHEDTPLSPLGHEQAAEVATAIRNTGHTVSHIIASPFLRTIQTSLPLSQQLQVPIKLEESVWETGCRQPPPLHYDKGFPIDETHKSHFTPTCGERPADFRPRLARAAEGILQRFPFEQGNVVVFSHADPVCYLVAELTGVDPSLLGPVAVCCMFRLERRREEGRFRLVSNADIRHLSRFGNTEPCHPIHAFHEWCSLFSEVRTRLARTDFRWPPSGKDMEEVQAAWTERYQRMITGEVEAPVRPRSPKKVRFECPRCTAVSYISHDLFHSAPATHSIKCWSCKVKFSLKEIS
jgi:broad specificity phosphatase PhoE